jgi:hypothetical protein
MDQTLPWGESGELVGVLRAATRPERDPFEMAPAATTFEEAEPAAPADERKNQCPAGHPYDDANTYVDPKGWRNCRICRRDARRRWRARSAKRLTPEQRVLRSRAAAYRLHATHDPKETTKKARAQRASNERLTPTVSFPLRSGPAGPRPPGAPISLAWRCAPRRRVDGGDWFRSRVAAGGRRAPQEVAAGRGTSAAGQWLSSQRRWAARRVPRGGYDRRNRGPR